METNSLLGISCTVRTHPFFPTCLPAFHLLTLKPLHMIMSKHCSAQYWGDTVMVDMAPALKTHTLKLGCGWRGNREARGSIMPPHRHTHVGSCDKITSDCAATGRPKTRHWKSPVPGAPALAHSQPSSGSVFTRWKGPGNSLGSLF